MEDTSFCELKGFNSDNAYIEFPASETVQFFCRTKKLKLYEHRFNIDQTKFLRLSVLKQQNDILLQIKR